MFSKTLCALILGATTTVVSGQNIVILESNITTLYSEPYYKHFEQAQTVGNVLHKLFAPSILRNMSPSYKLTQNDWDNMSKKFMSGFPADYFKSSATSKHRSTPVADKRPVIKLTYGTLNKDRNITSYAKIEVFFESNDPYQIIQINVFGKEKLPLLSLTAAEYSEVKKFEEEVKKLPPVPKSPPPPRN